MREREGVRSEKVNSPVLDQRVVCVQVWQV